MWDNFKEIIILFFLAIQFFLGIGVQLGEEVPVIFEEKESTQVKIKDTATTTAVVTRVVDGDTIDVIFGDDSRPTRIRYIGIDTPESSPVSECGSTEATTRNRELVENRSVHIISDISRYDKYGRLLAYIYVDDVFINETLLKEGLADIMTISPNTKYSGQFTTIRDYAKASKVGIWSWCDNQL